MQHFPAQLASDDHDRYGEQTPLRGFRCGTPDIKDFGRVVLGGGYAGISAPANPPIPQLPTGTLASAVETMPTQT